MLGSTYKKCFLSSKSAYNNDFLKDHVTLKTEVMIMKSQLKLKYNKIENSYFK